MENKILSAYENRPRTLWSRLALGAVLVALMAWSATAAVDYTGASGGGQIAASIISGILHPDLSLLFNFTTEGVPYLMLETICIAFLGTVVGAVLAIPLSFLTASNLVPKPIAFVGRMAIMAIRTVPSLVYGLMFVRVTGMGAFAGLMTMALSSIGMVSKMYIEAIEDLDVKILESLDAAGCTTFQKIRYGILPQPLYAEGDNYTSTLYGVSFFCIPKSVKDLHCSAVVLNAMNYLSNPDNDLGNESLTYQYYDTIVMGQVAQQPDDARMLELIRDSVYVDFAFMYDANLKLYTQFFNAVKNDSSITTLLGTIENSLPEALAKLIEAYQK